MKNLLRILAVIAAFAGGGYAIGHGGGLDQYGCHHDYKNGGYHCHR